MGAIAGNKRRDRRRGCVILGPFGLSLYLISTVALGAQCGLLSDSTRHAPSYTGLFDKHACAQVLTADGDVLMERPELSECGFEREPNLVPFCATQFIEMQASSCAAPTSLRQYWFN